MELYANQIWNPRASTNHTSTKYQFEVPSKLTRNFRAEIDSKFGSIRNVGIDLDKGNVMITYEI